MLTLASALVLAAVSPVVDHDLTVGSNPASHRIVVTDTMTLPGAQGPEIEFTLHAGLHPTDAAGVPLAVLPGPPGAVPLDAAKARVEGGRVVVKYAGPINHPPAQVPTEYQRSFQESPGTIGKEGVYLSGSTAWIPRFDDDELLTAKVDVQGLPAGWSSLTDDATHPLDELHLVAGPFHRFEDQVGDTKLLALLREPDEALARRYLEVTGQYMRMYEDVIGPYPWDKFALVENFWETGYGFPSFTLLGPKIIRFPFILHSSYPHELLHNWWGNSVYVDPNGGNWCEGLTAFLADHLVAVQNGKGAEYRRDTIAKYLAFVRGENDFPLRQFTGRISAASEAVGYGKWLMVLEMLKGELGDAAFVAGVRDLYSTKRYQRASFDDVRASFERASGKDLGAYFAAWVDRTGLPTIAVRETSSSRGRDGRWRVRVGLAQTQREAPYPLAVPIVVTTKDGVSVRAAVPLQGRTGQVDVDVPGEPARVDVDPRFETFRRLDKDEIPPALTKGLGDDKLMFVVPTLASADEQRAWRAFAAQLCGPETARCAIVVDKDVQALPTDRAVWVLGYGNTLRASAAISAKKYGARFDDRALVVGKDKRETNDTSVALAVRHPTSVEHGMVFVGADRAAAIPGLAKKLPHYGKYGFLGFEGDEPVNVMKGQWEAAGSPMTVHLAAVEVTPKLPPEQPLAKLPPPFDGARMKALVDELASAEMEGRGYGSKGLAKATAVVARAMKDAGLAPYEGAAFEACFDDKGEGGKKVKACNVLGKVTGSDPALPAVVLSAHLDHLGKGWPEPRAGEKGKIHPGADDDASGTAAVLEVARLMARSKPLRTVVFAIFTGEEAGLRGSRRFVAAGKPMFANVNLDTVGRPGPQGLLVLDGQSATEWVHVFMGIGFTTGVKTTLAKEGGGASDQQAFIEKGVPGVQLFGGAHGDYHRPSDTADKVSTAALVDAAVVAREAIAYLADRKEPLTPGGAQAPVAGGPGDGQRRASLGSVPDFDWKEPGVRFGDVVAGSAAEKAGLVKGDVLVELDGKAVADLGAFSRMLKEHQPGDRVRVKVKRGAQDVVVDVVLGAR